MRGRPFVPGNDTEPVVRPILDLPAMISMSVVFPAPVKQFDENQGRLCAVNARTTRTEYSHHLTGLDQT